MFRSDDKLANLIIDELQAIYQCSSDVKGIYLDLCGFKSDGYLADLQYISVFLNSTNNFDEINSVISSVEDNLSSKDIEVSIGVATLEDDLSKGYSLVPKKER